MAKRLILVGSPRAMGKSARVAKELSKLLERRFAGDDVELVRSADLTIRNCEGCNTCAESGECFIEDDMPKLMSALAEVDELYVVSPVYFAGPPANYKAILDRFQPLYWRDRSGQEKRPSYLVILGGGGDPHGFEPLIGCTRSALSVAGFDLVATLPYIGEELKPADIGKSLEADLFG